MLILASDTEICKDEKNVFIIKNVYNPIWFSEKMYIFRYVLGVKNNNM